MHGNIYDPSHKIITATHQHYPIYCQGSSSTAVQPEEEDRIQPFCKKQIPRMQQNHCVMENRKKSKSSLKAGRGYGFFQYAKSSFHSESFQCLTFWMSLQMAFDSVLFLFDHTCNSLKKAFKGLINKVSSLELKFPCIFNVFSCLLAAKCRSQDMWPFITIFSLNVPCLFISCFSGEDWYNNLNLTSSFDPVVWAINHKTCTEDWLLVKGRDIETNPKANQSKLKCIERVLKSKIMCLFVILLKERD